MNNTTLEAHHCTGAAAHRYAPAPLLSTKVEPNTESTSPSPQGARLKSCLTLRTLAAHFVLTLVLYANPRTGKQTVAVVQEKSTFKQQQEVSLSSQMNLLRLMKLTLSKGIKMIFKTIFGGGREGCP